MAGEDLNPQAPPAATPPRRRARRVWRTPHRRWWRSCGGDADAECFFNKGDPGRYCGVSLRRVWDDDERAEDDERSGARRARRKTARKEERVASHYTGNG